MHSQRYGPVVCRAAKSQQTYDMDQCKESGPVFRARLSVGGGLSLKAGHLRIEPEVRYTHWRSGTIQAGGSDIGIQSRENQADLLVGLTF